MSRLIVGPFNRVEGDLEVQLEVHEGRVREARVNAPMYRGFETMLVGRDPMDVLTIVPRICGICSVSQSVAAARALADAAGVQVPLNGLHAINLMLACESLADHLTHFYVFFMPDFTRACYSTRPWFAEAQRRFAAIGSVGKSPGVHARQALAARARWFELMGTLGGKWPHTGSVSPGGSARALDRSECLRMLVRVREMRGLLEQTLFGCALEEVTALDSLPALEAWQAHAGGSDMAFFLQIAADAGLDKLGAGPMLYLSYGAYPQDHGQLALAQGVWDAAQARCLPLDTWRITEDAHSAWLASDAGGQALHPAQGLTVVQPDKPGAYTWNKAPRLDGAVIETGAIARQLVDGHPLIRAAVAARGGTVSTRVLARLLEIARILPMMEQWLMALKPHEPFHAAHTLPDQASGVGLTEAARGALGHWLRIDKGRIAHYQIVAPTSWNFSPRDAAGTPGALEAALVGAELGDAGADAGQSVVVQHIVRSFDPCMVCTVH